MVKRYVLYRDRFDDLNKLNLIKFEYGDKVSRLEEIFNSDLP